MVAPPSFNGLRKQTSAESLRTFDIRILRGGFGKQTSSGIVVISGIEFSGPKPTLFLARAYML